MWAMRSVGAWEGRGYEEWEKVDSHGLHFVYLWTWKKCRGSTDSMAGGREAERNVRIPVGNCQCLLPLQNILFHIEHTE